MDTYPPHVMAKVQQAIPWLRIAKLKTSGPYRIVKGVMPMA
jgi:hypothetical protein